MKLINIHDAKTHLSRLLANLKPGDLIQICNRNRPIAELRALPEKPKRKRELGLALGKIKISKAFFSPLPRSIEKSFYELSS